MPNSALNGESGIRDVTGITGDTAVANNARLISQFGMLNIFAAALLVACGILLYFVLYTARNDALRVFQNLREDWREDRIETRDAVRELSTSTKYLHEELKRGNDELKRSIDLQSKQLSELKKITGN